MRGFQEEFVPGKLACVRAGLGGGFKDTHKLHVMKYDEAMVTPKAAQWTESVHEEHDRMVKHKVWKAVPPDKVPAGAKVLTSTWAMKMKSNRTFRARLNARVYEQVNGIHYDEHDKAAPVVSKAMIHIILIIIIMANMVAHLIDVCGAFLHGIFEKG